MSGFNFDGSIIACIRDVSLMFMCYAYNISCSLWMWYVVLYLYASHLNRTCMSVSSSLWQHGQDVVLDDVREDVLSGYLCVMILAWTAACCDICGFDELLFHTLCGVPGFAALMLMNSSEDILAD